MDKYFIFNKHRTGSNLYTAIIKEYLKRKYNKQHFPLGGYFKTNITYFSNTEHTSWKFIPGYHIEELVEENQLLYFHTISVSEKQEKKTKEEMIRRAALLKKYNNRAMIIKAEANGNHCLAKEIIETLRDLDFTFIIMDRHNALAMLLSVELANTIQMYSSRTGKVYDDFIKPYSLILKRKKFNKFAKINASFNEYVTWFQELKCNMKYVFYEDIIADLGNCLSLIGITDYKKYIPDVMNTTRLTIPTKQSTRDKLEYFKNKEEILSWMEEFNRQG